MRYLALEWILRKESTGEASVWDTEPYLGQILPVHASRYDQRNCSNVLGRSNQGGIEHGLVACR